MNIHWICKHFDELSSKEVYELGRLRQEIFAVEQNCVYQDFDRIDYVCWHILGTDQEDELVAYLRIVPPGAVYPDDVSIGRVVTSKKVRGKGVGRILMNNSMIWCKEIFGELTIRISAQEYLEHFYNSLGFVSTDKRYMEDGIPHLQMFYTYQNG